MELSDLLRIHPNFKNLRDFIITDTMTRGLSYDFLDGQLLEEKAVLLQEMTPEALSALGRAVIPMMTSGFSPYGVASIFTLAYHLRDPVNPDRFILRPAVIRDDTSLEDHDRTPISVSAYSPLPPTHFPVKESQAYSYIAASMLRLFIKPEDHYIKAFNHIVTLYPKFYRQSMNVRLPQPSIEAIRTFTRYIKQGRVFRMTLYRILYIGGGSGEGEELRRFLYETHLENAGLHILSIFTRLCSILDCPEGMLLSAINSKQHERALTALKKMIEIMNDDSDAHRRKMWRYGRIFDESFMSTMRTKSCPVLAYTMACMLKKLAPDSNRDILNIAQLSVVGPAFRERCPETAETIIRHVRRHLMSNSGSASASS